jgi:hypothetical protein
LLNASTCSPLTNELLIVFPEHLVAGDDLGVLLPHPLGVGVPRNQLLVELATLILGALTNYSYIDCQKASYLLFNVLKA